MAVGSIHETTSGVPATLSGDDALLQGCQEATSALPTFSQPGADPIHKICCPRRISCNAAHVTAV